MSRRTIGRLPYLAVGVLLFGMKCALDYAVSRKFGHPYTPLFYVSPMDAPLVRPSEDLPFWFTLWGVALPFIGIGFVLTVRRLRDAALPAWFALLFFVPFANLLFFAAMALAPSRPAGRKPEPVGSLYRRADLPAPLPRGRSFAAAVLLSGVLGAVIGLGVVGISVGLLRSYGSGLLLGAPVVSGFSTSLFYCRLRSPTVGGAVLATLVSFVISFGVIVGFAIEGLGCLIMALPLIVFPVSFGSAMGYAIGVALIRAKDDHPALTSTGAAVLLILPLTLGVERFAPLPPAAPAPVESEILVNAPPDVVWRRVIAFPPLAPPTEEIFRAGIAAPMSATIDGEGVGAIRRCEFTTGTFLEPIDVWRPGRELSFSVRSEPDPMREWTLRPGPRPPHLDGYMESTRGQFLLEPVAGGRTRLVGRTWYRTHMTPEPYWRLWADRIVHTIHMRVLRHVAALAESDGHQGG